MIRRLARNSRVNDSRVWQLDMLRPGMPVCGNDRNYPVGGWC